MRNKGRPTQKEKDKKEGSEELPSLVRARIS
jgi:hypothetical protein